MCNGTSVYVLAASMRPRHKAAEYSDSLCAVVSGTDAASMRPRHKAAEYGSALPSHTAIALMLQ